VVENCSFDKNTNLYLNCNPNANLSVVSSSCSRISTTILYYCFSFSALTLLVGRQEGHPACKKRLGAGLLVMMIWLELCTTYSSSCHHHFHHPFIQYTPANPSSPGEWPLKRREIQYYCCRLLLNWRILWRWHQVRPYPPKVCQRRTLEDCWSESETRCRFCHPTNSVKALKRKHFYCNRHVEIVNEWTTGRGKFFQLCCKFRFHWMEFCFWLQSILLEGSLWTGWIG